MLAVFLLEGLRRSVQAVLGYANSSSCRRGGFIGHLVILVFYWPVAGCSRDLGEFVVVCVCRADLYCSPALAGLDSNAVSTMDFSCMIGFLLLINAHSY